MYSANDLSTLGEDDNINSQDLVDTSDITPLFFQSNMFGYGLMRVRN